MMIVLSPSKSMDMAASTAEETTQPDFLEQSEKLINVLRGFSTTDLMEFMQISEKLAALNHQRFSDWQQPFTRENAKPAALAFTGDVYDGLEAPSLSAADLHFAQDHLRILSGLYGLLKPLDLIQPYRLEMGRPLATAQAKNLYEFWKTTVTTALNQTKGDLLINLASAEYFKAIDKRSLKKSIITPIFKDEKNGQYKVISFHAKKARGRMARYIVKNRISTPEALCAFAENGYHYNAALSTPTEPTFTRPE